MRLFAVTLAVTRAVALVVEASDERHAVALAVAEFSPFIGEHGAERYVVEEVDETRPERYTVAQFSSWLAVVSLFSPIGRRVLAMRRALTSKGLTP